ncbi:MAG: hypothetical protein ACE5E5_14410, partial [Phycisphaerae bacterium]
MSTRRAKLVLGILVVGLGAVAPCWAQREGAPQPPRPAPDQNQAIQSSAAPVQPGGGSGPVTGVCPGAGNCCSPHATPGCSDVACCQDVCSIDFFCCDTEWDGMCADQAVSVCPPSVCGGGGGCPGTGDCCVSNGTPGCNDAACCDAVCSADPFCCDTTWDTMCAGQAETLCTGLCSPFNACVDGTGNCCVDNPTAGCSDPACCTTVCELMPSCCDVVWGPECVALAETNCTCQPPVIAECPVDATGNCCDSVGNGTPGCVDECCCRAVCTVDSFCCDVQWDATCADEASGGSGGPVLCPGVCTPPAPSCPGTGSCFASHATPGCNSGACCNSVCEVAPQCCTVAWGPDCAAIATDVCVCDDPNAGACCDPPTGICEDGVTQLGCESAAGVWSGGQSCLDVVCAPPSCPDAQVTWLEPEDGFLDARQPHLLNDPTLPNGVAQIQVVAP